MTDPRVTKTIDRIVRELLEKHTGGVRFFDALDAAWRTRPSCAHVVDYFVNLAADLDVDGYVSTGRFGMYLHNSYGSLFSNLILVTGGLRTGAPMDPLDYLRDDIHDRVFCLLDDSLYSGRTRSLISAELQRHGGALSHTMVIYDGGRDWSPFVTSLYRYYDYYRPEPLRRNPNTRRSKPLNDRTRFHDV